MTNREHEQVNRERKIQKKKQLRRKRQLIKFYIKLGLCFVIFLLLFASIKKLVSDKPTGDNKKKEVEITQNKKESKKETKKVIKNRAELSNYGDQLLDGLENLANDNKKVAGILQQLNEYPKELLELLVKNPETTDFIIDYPANKNSTASIDAIDITDSYKEGNIPLFMQWDKRWGYFNYGNQMIALSGCGPTCLSMVAVGLTGNTTLNPARVANLSEQAGYIDENNGTVWDMMTLGAEQLGLYSSELPLDEESMIQEITAGRPIICSMGPGDFTTEGHFIVLYGYKDGSFLIHDPNSKANSEKVWQFSVLQGQIRNLWAFSS